MSAMGIGLAATLIALTWVVSRLHWAVYELKERVARLEEDSEAAERERLRELESDLEAQCERCNRLTTRGAVRNCPQCQSTVCGLCWAFQWQECRVCHLSRTPKRADGSSLPCDCSVCQESQTPKPRASEPAPED
jgi:hypothetical protein